MIWKILGSLLLLKYGINLSHFLWMMTRLYLIPRLGMKKNLKKYGNWAVVTGATDGIGKGIAKQLAKRGINLVLISRTAEKLKAVAEEFDIFNVEVKTITYDFNNVNNYEEIEKELQDLDIGILVNNVGVGYDHPEYFLELTDEFCNRLVNVNITSLHKMTRIVLSGMIKRKRGLIVHLSSASALLPVPMMTVYSATKAFVKYFGEAIQYEYANSGVRHQVITPNFVATNMSQVRARGIFIPSADRYAQMAVDAFGLSSTMTGWWSHELMHFIQSFIPEMVIYRYIMKMMHSGRRRWIRKQQKKE